MGLFTGTECTIGTVSASSMPPSTRAWMRRVTSVDTRFTSLCRVTGVSIELVSNVIVRYIELVMKEENMELDVEWVGLFAGTGLTMGTVVSFWIPP